jgi:hypothetical protein
MTIAMLQRCGKRIGRLFLAAIVLGIVVTSGPLSPLAWRVVGRHSGLAA